MYLSGGLERSDSKNEGLLAQAFKGLKGRGAF
jgi:hypothetical protein